MEYDDPKMTIGEHIKIVERQQDRLFGLCILALAISLLTLFSVAFDWVPKANAQSRDLTGGEILQHYNTDGPTHDISKMYIAGVIDGMSVSGLICPPTDRRKADFVQQVVYNLGANEQLHERRFDVAVSSAAIMAYPCGDPA